IGDPLAHAIRSARGHLIARAYELCPIDRVGGIMVSENAVDAAHFRRSQPALSRRPGEARGRVRCRACLIILIDALSSIGSRHANTRATETACSALWVISSPKPRVTSLGDRAPSRPISDKRRLRIYRAAMMCEIAAIPRSSFPSVATLD